MTNQGKAKAAKKPDIFIASWGSGPFKYSKPSGIWITLVFSLQRIEAIKPVEA